MSREDTAASFPSSLVNGSGTVYTSNIVVYYYYLRNAQRDVTGIVNASGTRVVTYTYDAWGNPLSTTGSMAGTLGALNPLRYRGYVYDTETGLYYLQSRYYDPEICRFINADGYASTGQGLLGGNMFAYCGNNPVCCEDPHGDMAAVDMLRLAFSGHGVKKEYGNDSKLAKNLSKSSAINTIVSQNIERYKTTGQRESPIGSTFSTYSDIQNYTDRDLSLAIGEAYYSTYIYEEVRTKGFWFWKKSQSRYIVA